MQIGSVMIANRVFAAPMAGVTDKAFRILAREAGCGLVYTEMVSDQALLHHNQRTLDILDISGEAQPIAVQIFGSDPDKMAAAARLVVKAGASIVDINMGCPTPKIVRNGEGAALMRDLPRATEIISRVVQVVPVPVTVKMRKGWDDTEVNAVELAIRAEKAGAAAVAVHGRTRAQLYSGKADWGIIREVKQAVKVPVIGNGDIWRPEDALRMMAETNCDAVMIGRGALGNPWLFSRTIALVEQGLLLPEPSPAEKIKMAIRHLNLTINLKGEHVGVREMRKHLAWYLKGLRGAARIREVINHLENPQAVVEVLDEFAAQLN
ncbi:MAG: tRNA dihydrouridine synthase DusB [Firmicutes bacterium]|nr:tRNA dihydrouridine synthase DusB [Bacillota bacterium]